MKPSVKELSIENTPPVPETKYFLKRVDFDKAVAKDFFHHANKTLAKGEKFMVALSHGLSPSGAYNYIIENYAQLKRPENIYYTFVNSPTSKQTNLEGVVNAEVFIKKLYRNGLIKREQVIGHNFNRESAESYVKDFNESVLSFIVANNKVGFDYVFLASNPKGRVAAIDRNSEAFNSQDIAVIVNDRGRKEITGTPYFLLKSKRIAFLATKADKRRPLAWLYSSEVKQNESPGFLRFLPDIQKRMTVFIDDTALTWPELEIERKTPYGISKIRVDTANPYNENAKTKLPVLLMIHGFLGLNSFDGLLADIPSHKYIAAAMHYGTIPHDLPPSEYSHHVCNNIDAVVNFFGENGHPVYIFDHSMGNIYFMMIDRELEKYPAIKKYLHGRIGANPFFGEEAKHATLGFLDNVIMPSLSFVNDFASKTMMFTLRKMIPIDSKSGVRKRGINLSNWLISRESKVRDKIWIAAKNRILHLMTNMDSLPHLNRIPIEKALNKLPAKIFAIQTHSALEQSIQFDKQVGLNKIKNIPILILKSEKDGVAKYVDRIYQGKNITVIDVTNNKEKDLFREHLYHMVSSHETTAIIDDFISSTERIANNS